MHLSRSFLVFCCCAVLCHAQAAKTGQVQLTDVRAKYDAPFDRKLESFACGVEFNWKQHWTETSRVGDEGTDEEIERLVQPIRNRVVVTRQAVTVFSGMTDEEEDKLPYRGMAERLLKHAVQKSLSQWLSASTNAILPTPATPVSSTQNPSGSTLDFKMQNFDVEMTFTPDMRLKRGGVKGSQDDYFETTFEPGPQGFLLTSWTMGEDGNTAPGHRLIFSYTYQTVDGVKLPEHVAIVRESHHEVWRYTLSGCSVKIVQ